MSNEDKCTYCREYGNLPCEECEKKAKEKTMSNTKFIKVAVSERLPSKKYLSVFTDIGLAYINEESNWRDEKVNDVNPEWFLEEVPDRESELIEMLEKVIHNSDVPHYLLDEAKELIKSVKQPKI